MTARILVVDDEPDMEALLLQKFRRKISEGSVQLLFARDGVEALDLLASNSSMDMVIADINMPRMDGLTLLQKLQETEEAVDHYCVGLWRHGQYPNRDEPRCIRFPDQADRF